MIPWNNTKQHSRFDKPNISPYTSTPMIDTLRKINSTVSTKNNTFSNTNSSFQNDRTISDYRHVHSNSITNQSEIDNSNKETTVSIMNKNNREQRK